VGQFIEWLDVGKGTFYRWRQRYGHGNEHNGNVPRDHWLDEWEKQAIVDFHDQNPLEGYRRLTFMMLDEDVVAVSPSSTYRVLKAAGRLARWNRKPSKKGKGFAQPGSPHRHWHPFGQRHRLHQRRRDILLFMHDSRRLQPVHRALGDS
jgi:hypothetical protein